MIVPYSSESNNHTAEIIRLTGSARTAITKVEYDDLKVLGFYLFDMIVAEITMKNGKILNRGRHDVIGAESTVAKTDVLLRRGITAIPLTSDVYFAGHVMVLTSSLL